MDSPPLGIIPAYAGSTEECAPHHSLRPDHPRIRGEHGPGRTRLGPFSGSSPHTRGARPLEANGCEKTRIIPAYAGSTSIASPTKSASSDHPRIRGEHDVYDMVTARGRGSSPHTRGAHCEKRHIFYRHGIIPAYAGSTDRVLAAVGSVLDHPRIRGEHASIGSVMEDACRIIPAYAGSTARPRVTSRGTEDHPRIRGEHSTDTPGAFDRAGSSPHTRGARSDRAGFVGGRGIIPAYAGSTSPTPTRHATTPDHPRIRGEHHMSVGHFPSTTGSSPHTRGALLHAHTTLKTTRIIPAYAGSTG